KDVKAPTGTSQNQNQASQSSQVGITPDDALKNALNLYVQKKSQGVDMRNGPCLGKIAEGWVLDIAHNPRQAIDDLPQNQCPDFKNGLVHHFIELDPDGKLIRSY